MAAIDNILASALISEIGAKLGASTSSGRKIMIPFEALEFAAQATPANESVVTALMAQLAASKGWTIKVYFSERKVEFSD